MSFVVEANKLSIKNYESENGQKFFYYSNQFDLINGIYRFYWNFTSSDLIGEIHVKTSGWVGFGLSPNGGMDGSDVIIGWINDNDGSVNFTVYLYRYTCHSFFIILILTY